MLYSEFVVFDQTLGVSHERRATSYLSAAMTAQLPRELKQTSDTTRRAHSAQHGMLGAATQVANSDSRSHKISDGPQLNLHGGSCSFTVLRLWRLAQFARDLDDSQEQNQLGMCHCVS